MYKNKIIRLYKRGHKNYVTFFIVVCDKNSGPKGFVWEKLGYFNPNLTERNFSVNNERLAAWVNAGAKINKSVLKLFSYFHSL